MAGDAIQKAAAEMQASQKALEAQLGLHGGAGGWTQDLVLYLSTGVLIFAAFVVIAAAVLMWRQRATGSEMIRVFGVIFIVAMATMLVIVGYSNEQLTPIIGLFGAIAGYLLGKDTTKS